MTYISKYDIIIKYAYLKIIKKTEIVMSKLKESLKKANEFLKIFFASYPPLLVVVISYCVAFTNEALSRRSIWEATVFVFTSPYMFFCNMLIIAVFLSLSLLSKKRKFWMWLFSIIFLFLGITNFVLMFSRITPFSSKDFTLLKSVFPIIPVYIGWIGVICALVAVLALIAVLIVSYFRVKKVKVNYSHSLITFLSTSLLAVLLIGGGMLWGAIPSHFSSLPHAYDTQGFTLSFSISVFDVGISKPKNYKDEVDKLIQFIGANKEPSYTEPKEKPNIIFVQLESFYDLSLLSGFEFSENPIPVFTSLKNNGNGGIMTVPSIGAGTANTEFEVLSGMSLKYFGAGEYPYETILQKKTCESISFILDRYGYSSHAVHNYKANFYSRSNAFSKLGFDTFSSIEYMNGLSYNQIGWAKDDVLTKYVMDSILDTDTPDFVQCITVQGHGQYPTSSYKGEEDEEIDVVSAPAGANKHTYRYFANQLKETDEFIGDLINALQTHKDETGEESIVVFYGDHIPNIGIEEEWLTSDMTLFDTEYVVWRSNGKTGNLGNVSSYQISSEVLSHLGFEGGMMSKLHAKRNEMTANDYNLALHVLQYDILYGDLKVYGGALPFKATDIRLGLEEIVIDDAYSFGEHIYIKGENFTQSSEIFVNGKSKDTEFVDSHTLILKEGSLKDGDKIKVVQVADYIFHISQTKTFIYSAPPEE